MSKRYDPPQCSGCRNGVAAPSSSILLVRGEYFGSVMMAYARDAWIEVVQCSISIKTIRHGLGIIKSFDESLPAGNNDAKAQ